VQPVTTRRPALPRRASGGRIRTATLRGLPAVLAAAGLDPAVVFAQAGVSLALLDGPDRQIPLRRAGRLHAACVAATGWSDVGLRGGQAAGVESLGDAGVFVRHSPTVGEALRHLMQHLFRVNRGAIAYVAVDVGVARLGFAVVEPGVEAIDQISDGALAIGANLMRALCGPAWAPSLVRLARRRPTRPGPYRRFYRASVVFDAPDNALLFPAEVLERPVPGADPQQYRALRARIDALERADRRSLPQRLPPIVRAALGARDCSARWVAALLSMHPRTLNRRLQAEGTTFRAIVEAVRRETAEQLLVYTAMPTTEIADALVYADPSVFTRAFRRWTGQPPSRWRAGRTG